MSCLDRATIGFYSLLFLLCSCKNEGDSIGFARESRLKSYFVDVPLTGSNIELAGIVTNNVYGNQSLNRLLVGRARHSEFGITEAKAITNFAPPAKEVSPTSAAKLDSIVLQLNLDFYHYGSNAKSTQKIQVFEVLDTLKYSKDYYSISNVATGNKILGETSFVVDPYEMDNKALLNYDSDNSNNDSLVVRILFNKSDPENDPLGKELLKDLSTNKDSIVSDFKVFSGKYKGFAIVMPDADNIIGINPTFSSDGIQTRDSKLSLYYSEDGKQVRADFVLSYQVGYYEVGNVTSFSQIKSDRSETVLSGIVDHQDFKATNNKLYVQGGTALMTKLDLNNFYQHVDTINNVIFNSAHLIVDNQATTIMPPSSVKLSLLDPNTNQFRKANIDTLIFGVSNVVQDPYISKLATKLSSSSDGQRVDVVGDLYVDVSVDRHSYEIGDILLTQFFQLLYNNSKHPRRINSIVLTPNDDEFSKSLNGLIIDENIILRLYYSKPMGSID